MHSPFYESEEEINQWEINAHCWCFHEEKPVRRWFNSDAQKLGETQLLLLAWYLSPETYFYSLVFFKVTVICPTHTAITMVHKQWWISLHSMPHSSLKKVGLDLWMTISWTQMLRTRKLRNYFCQPFLSFSFCPGTQCIAFYSWSSQG